MDLLKLATLVQQFRQAVADKKIWLAISLAGQITVMVASLFSLYSAKIPITGRESLQAELDALRHPDHARVIAICSSASPVQGIGGDLLLKLAETVIQLILSLLNWKQIAPASIAASVAEAEQANAAGQPPTDGTGCDPASAPSNCPANEQPPAAPPVESTPAVDAPAAPTPAPAKKPAKK